MENGSSERTEYQTVTSQSGEACGSNVYVSHFKCIRKPPQRYDPGFGSTREWKSDYIANIVCMIHYGDSDRNKDTDTILLLLSEWDTEDCMGAPSTLHMR